ncbi:MAG: sporulation protein [Coriobacteriia bacterium]|nr:sporulation protein [Coriobacteriia bacterium]NTW38058.1 sporulation protein [Syntrophobacteraceae bacterium]
MPIINSLMDSWKHSYTVRRVFGEPVISNNVTVIPVAMVAGGGGGGAGGSTEADGSEGEGGGFGGVARPAGVYVVKADSVEWVPALDITLLGLAGIALTALITLTIGRAIRKRR